MKMVNLIQPVHPIHKVIPDPRKAAQQYSKIVSKKDSESDKGKKIDLKI